MTVEKVIKQLVRYQPIIIAALSGTGRVDAWIQSIANPELRGVIKKSLSSFETHFEEHLRKIDTVHKLQDETSIRNQFHEALVGVPLLEVQIKRQLQHRGSGMPRPSVFNVPSPVDKAVKGHVGKPVKQLKAAIAPMKKLLTQYSELLRFLEFKLSNLEDCSRRYNAALTAEQARLNQAHELAREKLLAEPEAGAAAAAEEEEEETQSFPNSTPPEAAAAAAPAAPPRGPRKKRGAGEVTPEDVEALHRHKLRRTSGRVSREFNSLFQRALSEPKPAACSGAHGLRKTRSAGPA
ncbi:MAG: hypothetical protein K0U23_05655 [Gammaproteobacteria bacterium]|nr:hypothetical protein [Gammaproteobacteria bacterium]